MRLFGIEFRGRQTVTVDSQVSWQVRWYSFKCGGLSLSYPNVVEQLRSFVSEGEAKEFADALKDANALLKNTNGVKVRIERVDSH